MNATDMRLKTWAPAVPRKIPDNIVSSKYTTARVFVPSYEKESPRIERLLANDYQRIWLQEKQVWDNVIAMKTAAKKILPRMLIKRKVLTCATAKYLTRAEQAKEKQKKWFKQKNSSGKSKIEEMTAAEHSKTKSEEREETKLEIHEETKLEKEETRSKEYGETGSDTCEKAKIGKHEETESEKQEETQSKKDEELRFKQREETKSEKREKAEIEKREEMKLEEHKETQQKNNEELKSRHHKDIESGKCKESESHKELESENVEK